MMLSKLMGASRRATESIVLAKASDVQSLAREVSELRVQVSELSALLKKQSDGAPD